MSDDEPVIHIDRVDPEGKFVPGAVLEIGHERVIITRVFDDGYAFTVGPAHDEERETHYRFRSKVTSWNQGDEHWTYYEPDDRPTLWNDGDRET